MSDEGDWIGSGCSSPGPVQCHDPDLSELLRRGVRSYLCGIQYGDGDYLEDLSSDATELHSPEFGGLDVEQPQNLHEPCKLQLICEASAEPERDFACAAECRHFLRQI